jgi:tellurite resistance protein TerC
MDFAFLFADWLGKPAWMWLAFMAIVAALLTLDLGVLHKENREIEAKESLVLSAGYISLGLLFGAWVWWYLGPQSGVEYLTGFAIEKTLAMDNVFVIAMIFGYFAIPRLYQHRVLFWGILGVIVLRAIMIGIGAPIVENFSWVLYVFALFLVFTGVKMLYMGDK